jgi:hypothetical protein
MDGNSTRMGCDPKRDPCGQFKESQEPAQLASTFKQPNRDALFKHGAGEQTMGKRTINSEERLAEPCANTIIKRGSADCRQL